MARTLFDELVVNQLKVVPKNCRLQYDDLKRLSKYISTSIFDKNECSLWSGYITNVKHINKGNYVNFFFQKKKVALHRLLYVNFVDTLGKDEYLKFSCSNKGKCCNIHHFSKFKFFNCKTKTENIANDDKSSKTKRNSNKKTENNADESTPVFVKKDARCVSFETNKIDKLMISFD
jgi:hypothetical protein